MLDHLAFSQPGVRGIAHTPHFRFNFWPPSSLVDGGKTSAQFSIPIALGPAVSEQNNLFISGFHGRTSDDDEFLKHAACIYGARSSPFAVKPQYV